MRRNLRTGFATNGVAALRSISLSFKHVQNFNQRRDDGNSVPLESDIISKHTHAH